MFTLRSLHECDDRALSQSLDGLIVDFNLRTKHDRMSGIGYNASQPA